MRAILIREPGDESVLVPGDAPRPPLGPADIRIRVTATAVNRADLLQRQGFYAPPPGASPILGLECAGEVAELGPDSQGFALRQRVMALLPGGGYAEEAVVHHGSVLPVPDVMTDEEAGAFPEVFLTAFSNLFMPGLGALAPGEIALVHGGGGGVGTAAIQIARHIGANPVLATTRTPAKAAALRALGAHEVIDTRDAGKWVDAVLRATVDRGVDVIIDHVGGPMLADNIRVLALKARLVSVGRNAGRVGDCDLDEVARKRASIIGVTFRTRTPEESLVCSERFSTHLLDAVAKGALKPVLDRTFPFDRLTDAHKYMLSDAQTGKIVLMVDNARG